jgi:hypothetical protein
VLAPEALDELSSIGGLAQKRHRGFRKRPLEMDVADLRSAEPLALASCDEA